MPGIVEVTSLVRATADAGNSNALTAEVTLTMAAGKAVALMIIQEGSATRTFVVKESGSTTGWSELISFTSGAATAIPRFWKRGSHPGGSTTINVTHNNTSGTFAICAVELDVADVALEASDVLLDGATTTSHAASSGGLTTATAVVGLLTASSNNTSLSTTTAGGSWTKRSGSDNSMFMATVEFPSGCTGETGPWTSATSRVARSGMVLLSEVAPSTAWITGGWFGH